MQHGSNRLADETRIYRLILTRGPNVEWRGIRTLRTYSLPATWANEKRKFLRIGCKATTQPDAQRPWGNEHGASAGVVAGLRNDHREWEFAGLRVPKRSHWWIEKSA